MSDSLFNFFFIARFDIHWNGVVTALFSSYMASAT